MALDYVSIKGRLGVKVADSADEGDEPDLVYCDEGRIQFTPTLDQTVAAGEDPPVVLGMHPVTVIIDGQGYLSHQGVRYVKLPDLHSEKINPRIDTGKATWTVTFLDVKANGEKVTFTGGRIDPLPGENDLVELLPVQPASGGTIAITRGPAGVGVPEGGTAGQVLAKSTGDDFDTQWVAQSGGGSGTDLTTYSQVSGLADYPDTFPPDLSGVTPATIGAQPAGSYATTAALSSGLAGKQDAGSYATVSALSDASTADRDRANHTGEQAIATVTGLQASLDGKATTAQGALADTAVQPAGIADFLTAEDVDLSGYATMIALTNGLATKANGGIPGLPAGSVVRNFWNGTTWPPRPTTRTDISVEYVGGTDAAAPQDGIVGVDTWVLETV